DGASPYSRALAAGLPATPPQPQRRRAAERQALRGDRQGGVRRGSGRVQSGLVVGGRDREVVPAVDRPRDDDGPAHDLLHGDHAVVLVGPVVPRVAGVLPVVAHNPDVALGHLHLELAALVVLAARGVAGV